MKQHKRLRLVSIVCLAALLVSCLPGAYAYGVSSAWAKEELDAIRQDAEAEMDEAVKFADASPYPDPATVLDDMYVTDNERCVAR